MGLDRTHLNGLRFLSICPNEIPHARIPIEAIETIGNIDALVVYTILRSKPPAHRWKTTMVNAAIKSAELKIGKNRVEKAMAFLNRNGWISYVILKNHRIERQGSIVQVHSSRLPFEVWGKERFIQYSQDGSFKVYDFDGVTELSVKDFNAACSTAKEGSASHSEDNAAKAPVPREPEDWDSEDRVPEDRVPEDRVPEDRVPEDWASGEQYEVNNIEEPESPCEGLQRVVPLDEELGPGPVGPGPEVETLTGLSSRGCEENGVAGCSCLSGEPDMPGIDWGRVREMALEARNSVDLRAAYQRHLVEVVFPLLEDPPRLDRSWRAAENRDWCQDSAKGQFLLFCAVEDVWPDDLARFFRRYPSNCSLSDIRLLLRTEVFAERAPANLKDLIPTSKQPNRGGAWKSMVELARKRDEASRAEVERRIRNFPAEQKMTEDLRSTALKKQMWAAKDEYLFPSEEQDDATLFFALYGVFSRSSGFGTRASLSQWIEENRNKIGCRMARYVASDILGATVALEKYSGASQIWSFDWSSVMREHNAIAEELTFEAKLYGIETRVEPDPNLFKRETELDPTTRHGLEELVRERRARSLCVSQGSGIPRGL